MGLLYRYLDRDDLVVTVGNGAITAQVLAAFAEEQIRDPRWPFGKRRLADMTTVTSQLNVEDAETVASMYGNAYPTLHGVRQAIVVSSHWERAKAFEERIDEFGMTTMLFFVLPTACNWLGVKVEDVQPVVDDLRQQLRTAGSGSDAHW